LNSPISENPDTKHFEIYPNPNNGSFEFVKSTEEQGILKIYDAQGQEIYSDYIQDNLISIMLPLGTGYYFVVYTNTLGTFSEKMIIH